MIDIILTMKLSNYVYTWKVTQTRIMNNSALKATCLFEHRVNITKVVLSLPFIMKQNINAKTPLKFKGWLETSNLRTSNKPHYESINNKFWDYAHYTKNDNYALLVGA